MRGDGLNKKTNLKKLDEYLKHGDYITNYFKGIGPVFIGRGTLGPEGSWVSHILTNYLIKHSLIYRYKKVLDMGCGSGIQTIAVALNGASHVLAADISPFAIRSTKKNIQMHHLKNVECIKSDMFSKIVEQKFDLIIFNHPFLEGKPKNNKERIYIASKKMIENFFKKARRYLTKEGTIIMPFSHFCDHNPKEYVNKFNYKIIKEKKFRNKYGGQSIFFIKA